MDGRLFLTAAAALAGLASPAAPADPQYLGTWRIAEVRPAPWFDPKDRGTAPFDDRLAGKTVTFARGRIAAPHPLGCTRPHYAWRDYPREGLFQGSLTAPGPQAAALGFRGRTIRTLETGCEGPIDFHFRDSATALFALNNNVYVLRRSL